MSEKIEERWHYNACDRCGKVTSNPSSWDGWLSFTFCEDCETNHEGECWKILAEVTTKYFERARKQQ